MTLTWISDGPVDVFDNLGTPIASLLGIDPLGGIIRVDVYAIMRGGTPDGDDDHAAEIVAYYRDEDGDTHRAYHVVDCWEHPVARDRLTLDTDRLDLTVCPLRMANPLR